MSAPIDLTAEAPAVVPNSNFPKWFREPLLHFAALGLVLFAVDHFLIGRADDPRVILVDAAVDKEAANVFKNARGREPNAEELAALRQVWLDNEVLYREGLSLQVDKGDSAIRERVIFKALSVIDANVRIPAVDDATLHEWFEKHRDRYDEPARYTFQEAVLAGDSAEPSVRVFAKDLNAGLPGDAKAGLRIFKDRPLSNLVQSYGAEFTKELEGGRVGEWRALKTKEGWRAIRLDSIVQAKPADFAMFKAVAFQDWRDELATEQRTAAVRQLAKKYKIRIGTGS